MGGDQLFEEYDPDEEDIFGSKLVIAPKRITLTEQQITDPLRRPKVELQSVLVAEKQPISARDIDRRMLEEQGVKIDPKKYNFETLDDLLQACSDTIVHHRKTDGTHVYTAKVSEANRDIIDMVQVQSNSESRRAPRSFLSSGVAKGTGNLGASFRSYMKPPEKEDGNKIRGTPAQFERRKTFGAAKTIERVQDFACVLKEYRDAIGEPHPTDPSHKIVTLTSLAKKFQELSGLPAWGKIMSERELHANLDVPEFKGILQFWRLKEDGDIYVDECGKSDHMTMIAKPSKDLNYSKETVVTEAAAVTSDKPTTTSRTCLGDQRENSLREDDDDDSFSSIGGTPETSMLSAYADGNFFDSGPGFNNAQQQPSTGQQQPLNRGGMSTRPRRFGTDGQGNQESAQQSGNARSTSRAENRLDLTNGRKSLNNSQGSNCPTSRDQTVAIRSFKPMNKLEVLVEYIKSRGSVPFDTLPDDDKTLVNFSGSIFKVFSTRPGEMLVRLVNNSIDSSSIVFNQNDLREPVEADLRWMTDHCPLHPLGLNFVKPIVFVPPRGFLMMIDCVDHDRDKRMSEIALSLSAVMPNSLCELKLSDIHPGMAAVYSYRAADDVQYFRVLVLSKPKSNGNVMVQLVDHSDQYFADVQFDDLLKLPEKVGFKYFPPSVVFATLSGVSGLSEAEQEIYWRTVDDENQKKFVIAVLQKDKSKLTAVDMIWRDEDDKFKWLSQIAKRRGAILSSDANFDHISTSPRDLLRQYGNDYFMDFVPIVEQDNGPIIPDETQHDAPGTVAVQHAMVQQEDDSLFQQTLTNPLNPHNIDLYTFFDRAVSQNDILLAHNIHQFACNIEKVEAGNPQWKDLIEYMVNAAQRNNMRI